MKIKQAKLAQGIRGEVSNIIDSRKYDLSFDAGMLHVVPKASDAKCGPFIVFPANIAYLELEQKECAEPKAKVKK